MENLDLVAIVGFAREVGGNALLLLGLLAVITGRLVPKPFVDEIRRDRDEWKSVARGSTQAATQATQNQVKATDVAEEASKMLAELLRRQRAST